MATSKTFTIGLIIMTLLASGVLYLTYSDQVRIRIDEDKSTLYVPHEVMPWIWAVGGREYNRLFDGSSILYRDIPSIQITHTLNTLENIVEIKRETTYQRGPVIIDTYTFHGNITDVSLFPIEHKVEIINASGYFYRYTVDELVGVPDKRKLTNETKLTFGRNINVTFPSGYRWAWIGWPYGDDSFSAQYDILTDYEVFYVRLFDPPTEPYCGGAPGIYINGVLGDNYIEQGSNISICAVANVSTSTIYISLDHGELGTNYSYGLNSTCFTWLANSNIRKFNDSSLEKQYNFTAESNVTYYLYSIGNESYIESFYLTLEGVPSGEAERYWLYDNESAVSYDGYYESGYEATKASDGDYSTFASPLNTTESTIYMNYTCDNCTGTIDATKTYIQTKGADGGSTTVNWSVDTYSCAYSPVQLRVIMTATFVGFSGTINTSCWTGTEWYELDSSALNTGFYESSVYFYDGGNATYTKNVKIDLFNDSTYDFVTWGDLKATTIYTDEYNNSLPNQTAYFTGAGTTPIYLKLPQNLNVSTATMSIHGDTNNYFAHEYHYGFLNATGADGSIYGMTVAAYDGNDSMYMFGGGCTGDVCLHGTDYNATLKYTPGGGTGALEKKTDMPWESFFGGAVYYPGDGFYVFGGYDGTTTSTASDNMYLYDPDTDTWAQNESMPIGRYGMQYVLVDDLLYIFGGYDTDSYNKSGYVLNLSISTSLFDSNPPIVYYKMDETSGVIAVDELDYQNGTATDAAVFTTAKSGILGTVADLMTSNYINISTGLNSDQKSISVWIKPDWTTSESWGTIITKGYDVAWQLRRSASTSTVQGAIFIGSTAKYVTSGNILNNTWTHVVMTFDGTDLKLYVNGTLADTENCPGDIDSSSAMVRIGERTANIGSDGTFNGLVDELAIFSEALTTDQIDYLYNSGSGQAISYSNHYTHLSDMPDGMEMGWAEQLNDTHLIFYGGTSRGLTTTLAGPTFLYEIDTDTWTTATEMPYNLTGVAGASIDGEVYSFGGIGNGNARSEVYKFNSTSLAWVLMSQNTTRTYNGVDYDVYFYNDECDELDDHIVCLGGGGYQYGQQEYSIYFYPRYVTMSVGDYPDISYSYLSDLSSSSQSISDFTSEINVALLTCTADGEGYCHLPLYFTNLGSGDIIANNLAITTAIPRVNISATTVSCASDPCDIPLTIYGGAAGLLNISNMSLNYLGASNITITRNDSDGNSSSVVASIFYSNWSYTLANDYSYIEFIPTTPTSTNVTPYGQSGASTPMMNITTDNFQNKNMSWYMLVNETHACVNLTISNTENKTDGYQMNASWFEFADNVEDGYNFGIWMWADYDCNYSSWYIWVPTFYFRGCCEGCICDEGVE